MLMKNIDREMVLKLISLNFDIYKSDYLFIRTLNIMKINSNFSVFSNLIIEFLSRYKF